MKVREPIFRSEGQKSRSPGRLMLSQTSTRRRSGHYKFRKISLLSVTRMTQSGAEYNVPVYTMSQFLQCLRL